MERREEFPPLLLLRRYLKLAIEMGIGAGVMDRSHGEDVGLAVDLSRVPRGYPAPAKLRLWVTAF